MVEGIGNIIVKQEHLMLHQQESLLVNCLPKSVIAKHFAISGTKIEPLDKVKVLHCKQIIIYRTLNVL